MRAREFITEQAAKLPAEQADPMRYTYVIPGLSASDPYKIIDLVWHWHEQEVKLLKMDVNPNLPEWHDETAFGEHGIVAGMNPGIAKLN
jgi:hypothetical protein